MKKKISATAQDKKDWFNFTQKKEKIYNKESEFADNDIVKSKITKLDLHGESIDQANKKVKEFIIKSYDLGYKKIQIITGQKIRRVQVELGILFPPRKNCLKATLKKLKR